MPYRSLVSKELGALLSVLSHPARLRLVEELRDGERDVTSLQAALDIKLSGVSQHLSLLRAHRLVEERKEGRRVFYHLVQPDLAAWLVQGLSFVEGQHASSEQMRSAVENVRALWSASPDHP